MACNRWESEGLLYSSGELSPQEESSYQTHLKECSHCSEELKSYTEMQERFFIPGLLGDEPRFSMDALFDSVETPEVQEAPSSQKQQTILFGMPLFAFMQQRVAPALLLVMGVFVGYSFLPSATGTTPVVAERTVINAPATLSDSTQNPSSDSLREFREGGNQGIRSVNVVE